MKKQLEIARRYSPIIKLIKDEYKGYNQPFALTHYIARLTVVLNYTHALDIRNRIIACSELISILNERKNICCNDIKDWRVINWITPSKFFNN